MLTGPELSSLATRPQDGDLEEFLRSLQKSGDSVAPAPPADQSGSSLSNTHQGQSGPPTINDAVHVDATRQEERVEGATSGAPGDAASHGQGSGPVDDGTASEPTPAENLVSARSRPQDAPADEPGIALDESTLTYPSSSPAALDAINRDPASLQLVAGGAAPTAPGGELVTGSIVADATDDEETEQFENAENAENVENVENEESPPTDLTVTGGTVQENAAAGTVVATLAGVDQDAGSTFTYTLDADPSGMFELIGNEIRVKAGANLDYETAASHDLVVTVTDAGGLNHTETVTVTVTDQPGATIIGTSGSDVLIGTNEEDTISGLGGNDTLSGGAGNDWLDGGAGNDTMSGGIGDDTYIVSAAADTVTENSGEGTDTVQASVDYALGTNVENLTLTGSGNNDATGNALDNVLTGNSGNNVLDGGAGDDTMAGGAGNDTYAVDAAGDTVAENAGEGTDTVQASISYTLGDNVENLTLTGTGNIDGTGNALNNPLVGNSGTNILDGGAGNDTMSGGAGNDTYVVDSAGDAVSESSGQGTDTVQSSISYTLGSNVENLTLTGSGNINATGNTLDNILIGNAGNNTLSGGAGSDSMSGGAGDDIYVVDNAGDTVSENLGEGTDTVQSSISYALGANVENLTLTGSGNINATGNELDNILTGNSGNNVLDGGAGDDTMTGGSGNDIYVVDSAGDTVTEVSGQGTDTVQSSIGYTLGANVENLTLTGTDNIDATGNTLNNTILGNAGANLLDGGSGNDAMSGGAGDDTYVVDSTSDTATEAAGEGTDTIQSSVSYTLGANVENLTLTGSGNINATGNTLDNSLTGNVGNNVLSGGAGDDAMSGGAGDDTYIVDSAGDTISESSNQGTDTVQSSVGYTLGSNVENLTLTGSGNIDAAGNELDNTLVGNAGANVLDGGAGDDAMSGGAGNDTYVVDSAGDTVTEGTNQGTDTVQASISYTLGSNVENLTLTGTEDINATGNTLNNTILGNSGDNALSGGTGSDSMSGGAGDDIYVVDNAGDTVSENANEGTDTVQSSVSFALGANVENLTLTGNSNNISATGNTLDNTLTGNDRNNILDGGVGNDTMIGGAGNDTYVVDAAGDTVNENANEGTDTVQASINYVLGANVENLTLTGSGNIDATGNALNNTLVGNSGANILDGGAGNDTMSGGAGDDTYVVDSASDSVTESAGQGTDTVQASISYTLGSNVENLTLTGTGNINATGNTLDNVLTGNAGNNTLSGGTGGDSMSGGGGDDIYVVDNAGDTVNEAADEGTDTIQSSVTYTLGANVENITLTGNSGIGATGNELDNTLTGNSGANALAGGAGDDWLDGGTGNDTMSGGTGDDTYVVNAASDSVMENAGEGTDTVRASATYTLSANVENLILTGSGNINATGNSLDNVLTGNSGNNTLSGGAGNDTMIGGAGNDIYVVDAAGDTVTENPNEGTDTVQSSIGYTLGDNVENLTLTGSDAINATGNELDNTLTGNSGANVLDGGGGDDVMRGGSGNDTYVVDSTGDTVTESSGQGTDTVQASVSFTLSSNVENLTLTGSGNINATGNSSANTLIGNAGNNVLDGGTGNDTMSGGAGDDTYVVNAAGDSVNEAASEGTDTVQAGVTYTLGSNVENLTLTGSGNINGTGNSLDNALTGNSGNNALDGGAGNDLLTGGAGNDTMIGGAGDDLFVYMKAHGNDSVNGGSGWVDTVQLDQSAGSLEFGTDWTINLTSGSILSQNPGELVLSNDADGAISVSDGSQITLTDVERIHW
jgi:Ca2+-binding RTX toxin-like protein